MSAVGQILEEADRLLALVREGFGLGQFGADGLL